MSNAEIIEKLEDAAELMELTEVNVFKINAYRKLIQSLEAETLQLQILPKEEIAQRFSKGMTVVLNELLETGSFTELRELEKEVPAGVRSMLRINGIGPKKIRTLWKEAGIDDLKILKDACLRGLVSQQKGFGDKIQQSILEGIAFLETVAGRLLLHKADEWADALEKDWRQNGIELPVRTGEFATRPETMQSLDFLFPVAERNKLRRWAEENDSFALEGPNSGPMHFRLVHKETGFRICLHFAGSDDAGRLRFMLESGEGHWTKARELGIPLYSGWKKSASAEEIYSRLGKTDIPAELRMGSFEWEENFGEKLADLVSNQDVKGCLHNHSTWSDGKNSIREMAEWCRAQGWTYFGIADHSRSARYANGLQEDALYSQWAEIDALNQEYGTSFRIFKGIESDILGDGSLDYPDEILSRFDYVVASVHSIMKMDIRTATSRLVKAIENPFTSILGHCSGRILLRRPGYPLDYAKIIDACIANQVAIELNAHPSRLDMDYVNLRTAIEKGAMISVNPDAHEDRGMAYTSYGIEMARKAGAGRSQVLNCLSAEAAESYFSKKKSLHEKH